MATVGIAGEAGGSGRVRDAVLIAGPTASGKSAAALDLAERLGGVIVNTDSMQGYAVLNVLTARPGRADMARVRHELYGHIHPGTPYSTGAWLRDVSRLIDEGTFEDRRPVFVGGTGLYFRALLEGLSEMPEIPDFMRQRWRYRLLEEGVDRLYRLLQRQDPRAAALVKPTDAQRIVRALEVLDTSGRSILEWRALRGRPLIDRASARLFVLEPERSEVVRRIEERFERMIEEGALDEVRALAALNLDPQLPAMKAIGVRELLAAENGEMSLAEAVERAKIATRQYAKRQATWFRNQFGPQWTKVASAGEIPGLAMAPAGSPA